MTLLCLPPALNDSQQQCPASGQPASWPEPGPLQSPHLLDLWDYQHHQRPEDGWTHYGRGLEGWHRQATGHCGQCWERVRSFFWISVLMIQNKCVVASRYCMLYFMYGRNRMIADNWLELYNCELTMVTQWHIEQSQCPKCVFAHSVGTCISPQCRSAQPRLKEPVWMGQSESLCSLPVSSGQ